MIRTYLEVLKFTTLLNYVDCDRARKYVRKKRTFARCRTGMHFAVVKESSSPADDPLKSRWACKRMALNKESADKQTR